MKQYFRNMKPKEHHDRNEDFTLSYAIKKEFQPETRCKALAELGVVVSLNRLDDNSIMNLVEITRDLLGENIRIEHRHAVLLFYRQLIDYQYDNLSLMRTHFFHIIRDKNTFLEDIVLKLELLKSLTKNGRNIQYFEEKIGRFICEWMQPILDTNLTVEFLNILINLIKFNAAYLDENIVAEIVRDVCLLICMNRDFDSVTICLTVIETVICYTIFPNEVLSTLINTLCRTVNCESYCHKSWKIMRNLLGTNLGHISLLSLCHILNNRQLYKDEALLRGAVFYINMSLWGGTSIVPILKCTPSTVLLSFRNALKSGHLIVTYEVTLSMESLIQKCSTELGEPSWDIICEILSEIATNIDKLKISKENEVVIHFHDILDKIEVLLSNEEINADPEKFYSLIGDIYETRSDSSVKNLMDYKLASILATRPYWVEALTIFIEKFFINTTNQNIRLYAIEKLFNIINCNRATYEEEIVERILLAHFTNIAQEPNMSIRIAVVKILIDSFLHCDSNRYLELLEILDKLLNKPFELNALNGSVVESENDIDDINILISELIKVFLIKIYCPSIHAVRIYDMLMQHLQQHFSNAIVFEKAHKIRYDIFKWLLKMRSNALFQFGYPDNIHPATIKFSHYISIEDTAKVSVSAEKLPHRDHISFRRAFHMIIKALETETNWDILQLILRELPNLMQNKALIPVNEVDVLVKIIYRMIQERSFYEKISGKLQISDFHASVLTAMCSLTIYHQYFDSTTQKKIFEMLKKGLISRTSRLCVQTLTILILEMPDSLVHQLPDILFKMSQMSNTVTIAVPILEFLSSLNRLSNDRFTNFTKTQCMYVFAITLPYTNPYRFNHYTVSLAHHVLAGWFLKCRLPIRKGLVDYILKGLESNVRMPLEENKLQFQSPTPAKESPNIRARSYSLSGIINNDNMYNFHMELAETFIDFMARHNYAPCNGLPKPGRSDEHLFLGGQSMTWLVGHNIVTITTAADRTITPHRAASTSPDNSTGLNKYSLPTTSASPKNGWAEIYIRRPTGSISWIMRINDRFLNEFPLDQLNNFFASTDIPQDASTNSENTTADSNSENIANDSLKNGEHFSVSSDIPDNFSDAKETESDLNKSSEQYGEVFDTELKGPPDNPVRRIKSSPEMSFMFENEQQNLKFNNKEDMEVKAPLKMKKSTSHVNISDMLDSPKPKENAEKGSRISSVNSEVFEPATPTKTPAVQKAEGTPKKEVTIPLKPSENNVLKTTPVKNLRNNFDRNIRRGRSKTISFDQKYPNDNDLSKMREQQYTGISPSFIFLQLYHRGQSSDYPIKVDPCHKKSIDLLDLIPPFEIHKIGVLYVGPGQCNNQGEILKNRFGSLRFAEFLSNIGTLVAIDEAREKNLFIDLEYNDDGHFAYIWQDDIVQVTFHVATLMPNKKQDPHCNEKIKHIGNDFVTIVYNESDEEFNINTIKGQFNYASVIVQPMELNTNRIFLVAKQEIEEYICSSESKIVSDKSAPLLARQMALHANLASLVSKSLRTRFPNSPYASNWLERLRKIKNLKTKLEAEKQQSLGGDGQCSWW